MERKDYRQYIRSRMEDFYAHTISRSDIDELYRTYPREHDLLRLILTLREGTDEEYISLYHTRGEIGKVWGEVIPVKMEVPYWNFPLPIDDDNAMLIGYAIALYHRRQYERSYTAVENIDNTVEKMILCLLYTSSARWTDVIAVVSSIMPELQRLPRQIYEKALLLRARAFTHLQDFPSAHKDFLPITLEELQGEKTFLQHQILSFQQKQIVAIRFTRADLIYARTDAWNVDTEPPLDESIEEGSSLRILTEAENSLDTLIGLEPIKDQIRSLKSSTFINVERKKRSMSTKSHNLHFIITGAPGTGKTTIVDIIAKIHHGLGLLHTSQVTRCSRQMFQRTDKSPGEIMHELIEENLHGTLFIDEAYSIFYGSNDILGKEALDTLVDRIEHHQAEILIILAGYPKDMDRLINENAGLRSRFTHRINLPTYSIDDIILITESIAHQRDLILTEDAIEWIREKESELYVKNTVNQLHIDLLGNGRFCRNLIEISEQKMADRIVSQSIPLNRLADKDLQELQKTDVILAFSVLTEQIIKGGL